MTSSDEPSSFEEVAGLEEIRSIQSEDAIGVDDQLAVEQCEEQLISALDFPILRYVPIHLIMYSSCYISVTVIEVKLT